MRLQLVDENGVAVKEPYEVRIPGWTEERFFAEAPEEGFYEFKDGELIVHSAVNLEHQRVVGFLTFLLRGVVSKKSPGGEVFNGPGVLRPRRDLCREPDIFYVSKERISTLTAQYVPGAADFVIEVVSKGSRKRDLVEKAEEYSEAGVGEYWVVDPARREVVVHLLAEDEKGRYQVSKVAEGRLESAAVPGFWIGAGWLWQRPLPGEFDCLHEIAR